MKIPSNLRWASTGTTLGQGGQATVVKVTDNTGEHKGFYALKGLSKGKPAKAYERFARDIEAINRLDHSSIIRIIDHSTSSDDFKYYVMNYFDNAKSLKQLLHSSNNPFARQPLAALQLFIQLVEAIDAWSKEGIVHRDLSPANILVLPDTSVKVIDFGICQIDNQNTITLLDEGVGTQNYMAPECESGSTVTPTAEADLYSAGKILWSAVTNQSAFARESPAFNAKSMDSILPDVPEAWHLHHIFEKTIRHDISQRAKPEELLTIANQVVRLIKSRFPPLELIKNVCPVCGFGTLGPGNGLHSIFGNPNPPGMYSYQCSYCGTCLVINRSLTKSIFEARRNLS